jgi:hypothetical protein
MPRNLPKSANRAFWSVEPPKFCRHQPGNNWFLAKHDGVSEGYNAGFSFSQGSGIWPSLKRYHFTVYNWGAAAKPCFLIYLMMMT